LHFVSLIFRISHRLSSFAVNGSSLQETCLTGQLMNGRFNVQALCLPIGDKSPDGGAEAKNVVFIVYNFFQKCLNQSLAAAFRAPNRCGLLSTDFGRREV